MAELKTGNMNQTDQLATFQRWLAAHRGLLMKVVRSFSVDATDRDDLFQEVSFQLWNSVLGYQDSVTETTWIYRVALYTAIGWSRKEKVRTQRKRSLDEPCAVLGKTADPSDPRLDWLYEQIAMLDQIDRSLTLLLLDGFSYQEMAETLGMSVSNVGVRINRIKKSLIQKSNEDEVQ